MSYADLHAYCQDHDLHIRRNAIKGKILALTKIEKVAIVTTTLDTRICRGFYLSPKNTEHPFVRQNGGHVIAIARGLNRCWTRFVLIKELMHLFDKATEGTDTGEKFEKLLTDFTPGALNHGEPHRSEIKCFWRALVALCPEKHRKQFEQELNAGETDDYQIALKLRIPQDYVPLLFRSDFADIVEYVKT